MHIEEVVNKQQWKEFFMVPDLIYRDDAQYIPHIKQDIERILGRHNPLLYEGGCKVWILKEENKLIGRIAAFYTRSNKRAGLGFFECTDDQMAANLLFNAAFDFLRCSGKEGVEGPVNFGERDQFWGLMVKGYVRPSYQENYNPPYYQQLFENYGFEQDIVQTTQELTPAEFNLQKFKPLADKVLSDARFTVRHLELDKLQKYAEDFVTIYNKAWANHTHYVPITARKVIKLLQAIKPVIREELIWFTYAGNDPVAFYVSVIDINQIFKKLNGNLNLWNKLRFLWYKSRVKVDRIRGIVFGVIPEYQGMGLASGMIMKIFEMFEKDKHLKSTELAWVGNFNPKMLNLLKDLGAKETKVHITYYKKF